MASTTQVGARTSRRKRTRMSASRRAVAEKFKRRMLAWLNPVEYVNNMYGCHPSDGGTDYFKAIFGK